MSEPPHRLLQVVRSLLGIALLVLPISPVALHALTSEAEAHQIDVAPASAEHGTRARRTRRRSPGRDTARTRSVLPLPRLRVFSLPPRPPLRV